MPDLAPDAAKPDPKPAPQPSPKAARGASKPVEPEAAEPANKFYRVEKQAKVSTPTGVVMFREGKVLDSSHYGTEGIERLKKGGLKLVEVPPPEPNL